MLHLIAAYPHMLLFHVGRLDGELLYRYRLATEVQHDGGFETAAANIDLPTYLFDTQRTLTAEGQRQLRILVRHAAQGIRKTVSERYPDLSDLIPCIEWPAD